MEIDCLVCIFQKLSMKDLTLSVPFVCTTWFRASLSPLCWRVLDLRQLDFMPLSKFGDQFASRYRVQCFSFSTFLKFAVRRSCGSAVELRFPLFFKVSMEDLVYASNECPRLKILGMDSLNLEDEMHFPKLVGKWKELQQLEIEFKPSSFPDLAAEISLNCKKFRGLSMTSSITKEDASAIVTYLPKLHNLNLSRSYLPKIELLAIMDGCKELETLGANDCIGFRPNDEDVMQRASGLKFESKGSKLMEDLCCGIIGLTEFFVDFF